MPSSTHLPPGDLAARWHCSPGHLANMRSRGEGLPYVKVGRSVLYRLADVLAYEESRLVEPVQ